MVRHTTPPPPPARPPARPPALLLAEEWTAIPTVPLTNCFVMFRGPYIAVFKDNFVRQRVPVISSHLMPSNPTNPSPLPSLPSAHPTFAPVKPPHARVFFYSSVCFCCRWASNCRLYPATMSSCHALLPLPLPFPLLSPLPLS